MPDRATDQTLRQRRVNWQKYPSLLDGAIFWELEGKAEKERRQCLSVTIPRSNQFFSSLYFPLLPTLSFAFPLVLSFPRHVEHTRLTGPSPLEINEILDRVFSFLNQRSLRHAVSLVSEQWSRVATRRIHYHLHLDNKQSSWENLEKKLALADDLTLGGTLGQLPVDGPTDVLLGTTRWEETSARLVLALSKIIKGSQEESGKVNVINNENSTNSGNLPRKTRLRILALHLNLQKWWADHLKS